jgi:cell division inhibitor SepF
MAGLMRKAGEYLGLVDSGEYDDPYDDGYGYPGPVTGGHDALGQPMTASIPAAPAYAAGPVGGGHVEPAYRGQGRAPSTQFAPPVQQVQAVAAPAMPMHVALPQITQIVPKAYNDAKQIGEAFRSGVPVIMNLDGVDEVLARRLVDFAAGLTFGLRGSVERLTRGVFLLSPEGVQVNLGDAGMTESGFFNQS